jgi:WD40 repeat protein
LREVWGTEPIYDAIFLGVGALALVQAKKVTLHDLADETADGVVVVDNSAGAMLTLSAGSGDGTALCLGDTAGWLAVFDFAAWRAEPALSPPQQETQLGAARAAAAFSDDGRRLLTICVSGPLEVRDARGEGLPLLRTLDFCGPETTLGSCQLRSAGGLVAAVGGDGLARRLDADSKRARVWLLDAGGDEEVEEATLELPDLVSAVAVRGGGRQIAIGAADGAVRLFDSPLNEFGGEGWALRGELAEPNDSTMVMSLAYTIDGRRLVAGRRSGAFVVYDVGARAAVARFTEAAANIGMVVAIAPRGDVVAIGGGDSKLVTLRELVSPAPMHRWAMGGMAPGDMLAGAAAVGNVIALASDKRLEVHSRDGARRPLLNVELGGLIGCNFGVNNPVAIRPAGGHVVVVHLIDGLLGMTCLALPSGTETFVLNRADIGGGVSSLCWSPSGDILLVAHSYGVVVFDPTGTKLKVMSDEQREGGYVLGAAFSADGARFATAGNSNKIFVRDTTTWEITHAFPVGGVCYSPCFAPAGECVAAHVMIGPPAGSVLVHQLDDAGAVQNFPDVNAQGGLAFSADGGILFAAGALNDAAYPGHNRMVALSRANGAETDWSTALTPMALPPGTLSGITLTVPTTGAAGAMRLRVAVGSEFVEVDVGLARRAIDDHAWGYTQLVQLTVMVEPSAVSRLIDGAPCCLNIRQHASTGDTLLHYCAKTRDTALAEACLAPEAAVFVPIANAEGMTALHVALERREQQLARTLAESLTPDLTDATAALLTDALRTAALTIPEAVLPLLHAIEATVLVEHTTVRTLHHRAEVIGLAEPALLPLDQELKDPEPFESEEAGGLGSAAGLDLAPWNQIFPSSDKDATHTLVALKTLMLAGLAGDPGETSGGGAFRAIVTNCDASVFDSTVLQHVIQFKFETNVLPTLRQAAVLYTGATLLASAATLASSRQLEGGWDNGLIYIHAGQGVMVAAELLSLFAEGRQLARQDIKSYFTSPWNLMDVAASVALIVGAVGHFQRSADMVHLFGALGVALKWFSDMRGLPTDQHL